MATSELEYFSRMPTTIADAQNPISTGQFRFALNNGLHIADECWNPLVSWVPDNSYYQVDATASGQWRKVITFGPFNLSMKTDGTHYPIRIFIGGSSDKGGDTVRFRIVIAAPGSTSTTVLGSGSNVSESALVGNTPSWLAMSNGYLIQMDSSQIAECQTTIPVNDVLGGLTSAANVTQAMIEVWGTTTAGTSDVRLYGVHAWEVCGL